MPTTGIAFAPNVTPGTFDEPSLPPLVPIDEDSMLFPSQESDTSSLKKTHGRKKPENHIPRPPNAFILFRSSFIKNRHVSTGVETNHSTLSKIIGLTWQNLPNDEREVWHRKAKQAEEQHRRRFPEYAFRPLHKRKEASSKRKVREVGPKDEKRCAKIAELLVQGKKGKELDDAVKEFDKYHVPEIVTRFEAPITEESFQVASSGKVRVKEEETESIPRSRSSSARRSRGPSSTGSYMPSPLSTEMLPLPSFNPQESSPQYSSPSFDQFSFGVSPADEQQFVSPKQGLDVG
jgi:HMG (high mobility group) box